MIKIQKGFSLVELLIYMALMSIFLMVLLDVFTATLNTKLASESTSALVSDSRYIFSKLSYDIKNADSVILPAPGVTNTSLEIETSGSNATYALDNGNLVRTTGGVSMNLNSIDTKLDSISFKNIGSIGVKPTIQISYTLKSKVIIQGRGAETQTINTTIGTR